ncbi:hypothetical protein ON010_g9239 [Phytophthora cinnamomi]|nr:hypothetical protein ON010_g9239 [Phytophthora cinnamomi]
MPPSSLRWDESQMPPQHGRLAVVTGANTGLGFATSLALARAGAYVVLACRNEARGLEAQQRIRDEIQAGSDTEGGAVGHAEYMQLDVGALQSVRDFASPSRRGRRVRRDGGRLRAAVRREPPGPLRLVGAAAAGDEAGGAGGGRPPAVSSRVHQ